MTNDNFILRNVRNFFNHMAGYYFVKTLQNENNIIILAFNKIPVRNARRKAIYLFCKVYKF